MLRVLQVEDRADDAALIVHLLKKAGYEVRWRRVEEAGQMRAALAHETWDVIIADYCLPRFDAPGALRVLRETGEDIPFIVVSGAIGEDLAVEMMRSGAQDYLMKSNLARLAPAVEREITQAQMRHERRQAEAGLRETRDRLALAIQATQLGTFDFDLHSGKLVTSEFANGHFGLPPGAEVSCDTLLRGVHPEDRERVEQAVHLAFQPEGAGQFAAEYRSIGIADGIERWLSSAGRVLFDEHRRPLRFVGVTLDITERKHLEEHLRQAEKLETIGRLAAGVAHDFNNLLTVIFGYLQMVFDDLAIEHPLREPIQQIYNTAVRAAGLTRQLLAFSRRQVSQPKDVLLNDLVRDCEKMLRRLIGQNIELVLSTDPEAGAIRADPCQLEQVIMNLAVNAKDAMPGGGKLLIETSKVMVPEKSAQRHALSLHPGAHVMLAVTDTGVGMSPEVRAHIFEPFFTTKKPGKGTGLGLSTVYGIVRQAEGSIWVQSELGQGTTFKILFPALKNDRKPTPSDSVEDRNSPTPSRPMAVN